MESLDLIPKVAKRKSILVKIPREIVNMDEDEKEESKSAENQQAADLFSLNDSVFNLIRRYKRKWRLLYDIHQIEELEATKVLGSVNKYTFQQPDNMKGVYKIRLDHLWSLFLGAKYEDLDGASDLFEGAATIKVERVLEIDANNALLRYGDDDLMLVNFRVEKTKHKGGESEYSRNNL